MVKRWISMAICVCMMLGVTLVADAVGNPMTAGGWNETIWAEIPGISDADVTAVHYVGTTSGQLVGEDLEYLVRDQDGSVRIDILGVPAGTYTLTVTTAAGTLTKSDIVVEAQDRSGYAHYNYTDGVGAYNDDGTLKDNAIVLYVTEGNKDTVSITSKDGTTVTGIGNILNSRGRSSSAGSKTNTNQDILRKLAADGTPLVVRIIGAVTLPQGLTAYNSTDYGGSVGDNGAMARMQGGKDITIEGVGVGAVVDGWGLHFICGGGDYARGWGKSFEVRNLTFRNVPEDCVGMEGEQEDNSLTAPVERCWIHHCAFYGPTIAKPAESDKSGGDGACDFKRGQYFTNSYCYYEGYHKTNLVGSSDSSLQYHLTYHHNYWKNCQSRGPLARQANIHMYNNIFEGQTSYCMNPRANAYIFSEYNLFRNSKNPVRVKLGAVKSYGDFFVGCSGDNHATIVTEKDTLVDTNCRYANFDTNPELSYIPTGDYLLQDSISAMQTVVQTQAGPQGRGNADAGGNGSGDQGGGGQGGGGQGGEDSGGTSFAPGTYTHNFTTNGLESDFFAISGNLSTFKGTVSMDGLTLTRCLKIESSTSISFVAPESGKLTLVFGGTTDAAGKNIKIDGTRQTIGEDNVLVVTVLAGSHTISKGDSINLFFMAYTSDSVEEKPHSHSYVAKETTSPTCQTAGVVTYTCACGDSYTEPIPANGHELVVTENFPTCTEDAYVYITCANCDFAETQRLPATGHKYGQDNICIHCGEKNPDVQQTRPTKPATEPKETAGSAASPTVPAATEPQPAQKNEAGKTVLIVIFAVVAIGFTVAAILEMNKKK